MMSLMSIARTPEQRERNAIRSREWQQAHPDRVRDATRRWRAANPEQYRDAYLLRLYGIGLPEYEAMLAAQGGVCAICRQPETARARGGGPRPLSVDHDHETGKVRGLLCLRCNRDLAVVEDGLRLDRAMAYLRQNAG
jgi:hypothetical protein